MELPLNAGRSAFCERANILHRAHCGVAGERRKERSVRPAEIHRVLRFLSAQQSVDEARRESISAANPIMHVQLGSRRRVGFAVDPGDRAQAVVVRGIHLA